MTSRVPLATIHDAGAVLCVEGVSRRFRRLERRTRSLKDGFVRLGRRGRPVPDEAWALRDVSFSLARGESLGLCGDNGAGKSTLLRLLARILPATRGTILARGRIGALLELGAGFLPELTGRENVLLSGALLGIDRRTLLRSREAIAEFAELDGRLDSPVRTYSAGMLLRLGFAVAVHADADVLLIDEVLAVGDAAFQSKCLARLETLRRRGVSRVIASHSPELLETCCDRLLWLDRGRVAATGRPRDVLRRYAASRDPATCAAEDHDGSARYVRARETGARRMVATEPVVERGGP